jgi:FAD/FMN-containing dehydrogenase
MDLPIVSEAISTASLSELKSSIQGELFTPGDDGYQQAWMGWNLSVQQSPAIVIVARSAEDISQALRFASAAGMGVSVQSTGHGVILPADGGMLIVTSELTDVSIDPDARTARVGAGVKWGAVLEAAQTYGLAPLLGSSPTVGVVGYTLGGGLGWLARKYGLAVDSVRSIDLVTADGNPLTTNPDQSPDLFWAMRGGGGGFGAVTALELELYPVAAVYGGTLIYPVELAEEVLQRYAKWTLDLPEDWTTSVKLANFPPVEMLPEFLRGKSFAMLNGCYCGSAEEGEAYLKEWLDWGAHIQSSFRVMPFSDVASISQDPVDPSPATHNGAWLKELNPESIGTILQFATPQDGPCPITICEVRHVGGAMGRVPSEENAYGLRDCPLLMDIVAFTPTPEFHAMVNQHIRQFKTALEPHLAEGAYMNFLEGEEARQRTRQAFPGDKFERLSAIKRLYDPQNLFRFGYNIPPNS